MCEYWEGELSMRTRVYNQAIRRQARGRQEGRDGRGTRAVESEREHATTRGRWRDGGGWGEGVGKGQRGEEGEEESEAERVGVVWK